MKYLSIIAILAVITALSIKPQSIEERVQIQLEKSEALHDSAMILLQEIHDKNDSLLIKHFGK